MGRKITETPEENEGFCGSRGRMSSACPQIYSLGTSVWGGKFVGTPIVCLHFRGNQWTRKLTELPWFSITFGGVHEPEKQWKLKVFHYFQGGPWAKKTIGFQSFSDSKLLVYMSKGFPCVCLFVFFFFERLFQRIFFARLVKVGLSWCVTICEPFLTLYRCHVDTISNTSMEISMEIPMDISMDITMELFKDGDISWHINGPTSPIIQPHGSNYSN